MNEKSCENCQHFVSWNMPKVDYWKSDAEGVCTAPRPMLGPEPKREVNRSAGKHCPMFKE